jgi:LemA protein
MELIVLVVFVLAAVIATGYLIAIYNGLILVKNNIDKAWANIDVLLKQRHDELPKLIDVCKGYMEHEKGVFDKVMEARQALMVAPGPAQKGQAEGVLQGALRQLFALSENYPNLRAQESFQQLQNRVSMLESQIADRREFYNDSVNTFNIRIASIPDMFVAKPMGLTPREMFKVSETDKEDVKISFK